LAGPFFCRKKPDGDRPRRARRLGAGLEGVPARDGEGGPGGDPSVQERWLGVNKDLEHLIALQRLDSAVDAAHRRLAEESELEKAHDARIEAVRQRVADAKGRLNDSQQARRALEKDVAVHQGRLSKFRDQLMEVKTNVEYQAMQKEIEFAQHEVKAIEDKVLERMLEGDELAATVKRVEGDLAAEQKAVDTDRRQLKHELGELRGSLERFAGERGQIVAGITPKVLAVYDLMSKRRHGVALAEARAGICTICHVRLRPQVFNTVRRNEELMQCDSCQRILYFVPAQTPAAPDSIGQPSQP
jgi:predicted  nucleic acid-binding Zn-ribbon protein